MRALITGITGFLGQHLARALCDRGVAVVGVARRASRPDEGAAAVSAIDLRDPEPLDALLDDFRPTHVFHLAAALRTENQSADAIIRANVTVTQQLMERFSRREEAPVIILPSSAAVYGRPQALPIGESHPTAPLDLYGVTKAAQELIVEQSHRAWGCPVRILRIFNMVGPGQPTSLVASSIAHQIAAAERGGNNKVEAGDLTTRRDHVDVRDVAQACIDAAAQDVDRAVFNVCSGTSTQIRDCVDLLIQSASIPVDLVLRKARLRANDIPDHRGDPTCIRTTLGWQSKISLATSMADLLNYWRDRLAREASA